MNLNMTECYATDSEVRRKKVYKNDDAGSRPVLETQEVGHVCLTSEVMLGFSNTGIAGPITLYWRCDICANVSILQIAIKLT